MPMSVSRKALPRLSHTLQVVRNASTVKPSSPTPAPKSTSTYARKPISTTAPSSAAAVSRKAYSKPSTSAPPSYASGLSDFDSIASGPPAPSRPSGPASSEVNLAADLQVPPPPLRSFPDERYQSLPEVRTPPAGEPLGDWNTSFAGLSFQPFPAETAKILMKELEPEEIEVKPDGILFMPEIRYRRRLNMAFGPGGWGMAPRGEPHITEKQVSREWGLICLGRLVSVTRGESDFFDPTGINKSHESAKSNALMRCCKDLGIASELWDPTFIKRFKEKHVVGVWATNKAGMKKRLFRKKGDPKFDGAWKEQ